ncbi:hypothetical protein NDU88_001897 [Pleurodeles waltl]|uniref:Uncharacterized protein n=1 Tax=Pleurodeles waltl TaxID=8319 RepID=A0AAV7R9V5_PLEWA|nr:hypothetical protein NDU88_001897 [Pleurodeles waltl]
MMRRRPLKVKRNRRQVGAERAEQADFFSQRNRRQVAGPICRRLGIILLEREDFERAHHREELISGAAGRGPDLRTFLAGHEDFERNRTGGRARAQFTEVRAFRLGGKLKKELAADPGAHCFRKKR